MLRFIITPLLLLSFISASQAVFGRIPVDIGASSGEISQVYRFRLTECNGKKLKQPATFYLNTESVRWTLDFNSGDKVVYKILSGNQHDPLCGLDATDSFGDKCSICIEPSGSEVTITFNYYGKKMIYRGSKI